MQILLNIKMIDNKILNDFSEKTSINEKEKLVVEMIFWKLQKL